MVSAVIIYYSVNQFSSVKLNRSVMASTVTLCGGWTSFHMQWRLQAAEFSANRCFFIPIFLTCLKLLHLRHIWDGNKFVYSFPFSHLWQFFMANLAIIQVVESRGSSCLSLKIKQMDSTFQSKQKRTVNSVTWKLKLLSNECVLKFLALINGLHPDSTECPLLVRHLGEKWVV